MALTDGLFGGLAGGLVNGLFNMGMQNSANKTNIRLQREQNLWNEKMWNMNNEYNLPINQVQRLKDAGLNVGLMYSQGHGDVGNSSSPAQGTAPAQVQPLPSPFSGLSDSFFQIFDRLLMQKVKESEIGVNRAKSINLLAGSELSNAQKRKIGFEVDKYLPQLMGESSSRQLMNEVQTIYIQKQADSYQVFVDKAISESNYTKQQTELLKKSVLWFDKLQAATIYSQYTNANAARDNAYFNGRKTVSQTETEKVLRDGYRLENSIKKQFGSKSAQYQMFKQKFEAMNQLKDYRSYRFGKFGTFDDVRPSFKGFNQSMFVPEIFNEFRY